MAAKIEAKIIIFDLLGVLFEKIDPIPQNLLTISQEDNFLKNIEIDLKSLETLKKLKQIGFKLGIITNLRIKWGNYFLQELGFDYFVSSISTGYRKPDPKIYQKFLEKLNFLANQCVYIDDKIRNLKPAKVLGMTTILLSQKKELSLFKSDFRIKKISDLEKIFFDF